MRQCAFRAGPSGHVRAMPRKPRKKVDEIMNEPDDRCARQDFIHLLTKSFWSEPTFCFDPLGAPMSVGASPAAA